MIGEETEGYDFTGRDPTIAMTPDELENFDEGMSLKNTSPPANKIDFARAVRSTIANLDRFIS